jgi:hypothetical protein
LHVDVRDLQLRARSQAQPAGLDHAQTHLGGRVVNQSQEVPDLLPTQDDRQRLALLGSNAIEDRPWSLPRALVEASDPVEVKAERALGDLLLLQEEAEGVAELLVADVIRSPSVVLGQMFDGFEIALRGPGGQAPELEVFQQTASERSHRDPPVRGEPRRSQKVTTNQEDRWQVRAKEDRKRGERWWARSPSYRVAVSFNFQ